MRCLVYIGRSAFRCSGNLVSSPTASWGAHQPLPGTNALAYTQSLTRTYVAKRLTRRTRGMGAVAPVHRAPWQTWTPRTPVCTLTSRAGAWSYSVLWCTRATSECDGYNVYLSLVALVRLCNRWVRCVLVTACSIMLVYNGVDDWALAVPLVCFVWSGYGGIIHHMMIWLAPFALKPTQQVGIGARFVIRDICRASTEGARV